jgi:hypothetical protein
VKQKENLLALITQLTDIRHIHPSQTVIKTTGHHTNVVGSLVYGVGK